MSSEENPIKENDHLLDALRYALSMKINNKKKSTHINRPTTSGWANRHN